MSELFDKEGCPPSVLATREPEMSELNTVEAATPMALLAQAVQGGLDTDQLKALVDLSDRWEDRAAEKAFAKAMHAAQSEMPNVLKDAQNSHTKTRYAMLETVQRKAKPVYDKHGFCLSFGESDCPLDKHKRTVCDVSHIDGHTRRYHLDLPVDGSGAMNAVQGCISTTSYAQRRLLCMIFNITLAGEDDDGGGNEPLTAGQRKALDRLIDEVGQDVPMLLRWAGVDSLDEFPARMFKEATEMLGRKKRGQNGSL